MMTIDDIDLFECFVKSAFIAQIILLIHIGDAMENIENLNMIQSRIIS